MQNMHPKGIDELYDALWHQMMRAIGRAVVNNQTNAWPDYFNGLRDLTRRLVAQSTTSGLTENEKEILIRRLVERIDQLEKWWPDQKQANIGHSKMVTTKGY